MNILTNSIVSAFENSLFCVRNIDPWPYMQRAARALYQEALFLLRHTEKHRICVGYIGKGNNGADTLLAMALLIEHGYSCHAVLCFEQTQLKVTTQRALDLFLKQGGQSHNFSSKSAPPIADLILDGILGSGARVQMDNCLTAAIQQINISRQHSIVLSVDLPSGLDPESGQPNKICVRAHFTLCMGWAKSGLLTQNALAQTGSIEVAPIFEETPPIAQPEHQGIFRVDIQNLCPHRPTFAHKGSMGKLLVIAGSEQYPGAAVLALQGALASGCGIIHYWGATPDCYLAAYPEVIRHPYGERIPDHLIDFCDSILIGPGLGLSERSMELLKQVWHSDKPLLIDADAITLVGQTKLRNRPAPTALSPHPKEAEALGGMNRDEILEHPQEFCRQFSKNYGLTLHLKGHFGWLGQNGQTLQLCCGNSILARGGSGDVLAGLWAGLMARTRETWNSGQTALWLHGRASDLCAIQLGTEAYRTSDLAQGIRQAWLEIRS